MKKLFFLLLTSLTLLSNAQNQCGTEAYTKALKKKYYKAALVPYLTAAALTVKLSEPIKAYGDLAQAKIESIASNPMELLGIKKTLKTGMFVVKNVPKLIINIGKSSKGLLTYSKQNGLDVSEASSIEL